jgi:hypothetical protein
LALPCIAENDIEAGSRPITGVEDVVGATVDVVGVKSWVSPGIAVESFCRPRPLVDAPAGDTDEPGGQRQITAMK